MWMTNIFYSVPILIGLFIYFTCSLDLFCHQSFKCVHFESMTSPSIYEPQLMNQLHPRSNHLSFQNIDLTTWNTWSPTYSGSSLSLVFFRANSERIHNWIVAPFRVMPILKIWGKRIQRSVHLIIISQTYPDHRITSKISFRLIKSEEFT